MSGVLNRIVYASFTVMRLCFCVASLPHRRRLHYVSRIAIKLNFTIQIKCRYPHLTPIDHPNWKIRWHSHTHNVQLNSYDTNFVRWPSARDIDYGETYRYCCHFADSIDALLDLHRPHSCYPFWMSLCFSIALCLCWLLLYVIQWCVYCSCFTYRQWTSIEFDILLASETGVWIHVYSCVSYDRPSVLNYRRKKTE